VLETIPKSQSHRKSLPVNFSCFEFRKRLISVFLKEFLVFPDLERCRAGVHLIWIGFGNSSKTRSHLNLGQNHDFQKVKNTACYSSERTYNTIQTRLALFVKSTVPCNIMLVNFLLIIMIYHEINITRRALHARSYARPYEQTLPTENDN